jgi:hypothetical protein
LLLLFLLSKQTTCTRTETSLLKGPGTGSFLSGSRCSGCTSLSSCFAEASDGKSGLLSGGSLFESSSKSTFNDASFFTETTTSATSSTECRDFTETEP